MPQLKTRLRQLRPDRILRRLNTTVARIGPYRFIKKRYFGSGDIALTSQLIEMESFRRDLVPLQLPIANFKSIMLLAPHQDDEVIGAGGTLILCQEAGVDLAIVYCTDGNQFGGNSEVRRKESKLVCQKLGARMFELGISNLKPQPVRKDVENLNDIIHTVKPEVILCPWLLDGAVKHRMINHLLWLASRLKPLPNSEIWGYQVNNTLLPNGYVDISQIAEAKRSLLNCFPSQNGARHWDHVAMGLAAWNSRFLPKSKQPKYAEIFLTLPTNELLRLIEIFYFADMGATYIGEATLAQNLMELHRSMSDV